jgi:hypothetical protein
VSVGREKRESGCWEVYVSISLRMTMSLKLVRDLIDISSGYTATFH